MENIDFTGNTLELIENGSLSDEEFADYIEQNFLINAPGDLKSSIMKRCSQPDVQLSVNARKLSRRTRLLLYSLKVGAAVAASVLLLVFLPSSLPAKPDGRFSVPLYHRARQITDGLNRMSYELSNWEVYLYDEKKE